MKSFLKVTISSALLTLLRIGSGFIVAKAVAVYAGPGGMAMLGQLQNMIAALNGVVTAPVGNGLIRYTAEHHANGIEACAPWWRACTRWLAFVFVATVPIALFFTNSISEWIFGSSNYAWLIVIAILALPLAAINTLLASVTNGLQQYKRFIGLSMVSVVIATAVMLSLVVTLKVNGALMAAALFSGISGTVMIIGTIRQPWFRLRYWIGNVDKVKMRGAGAYVAMAAASALCVPISLMLVRNLLVQKLGWSVAGQWQAVYKISEVYLGVITMALSTYYLPRLSAVSGFDAIKAEIWSITRFVMPIVCVLAIIVYCLRDVAISLLFTEQFRAARDLFAVQLLADVVKILSWLFAFPMLSRGAAKWFIGTEVIFSLSLPALALLFVDKFGANGANLAYLVNYILYFAFVYKTLKYFSR